ncbi:hypothetical protein V1264_009309 [Littorina saxatilis]|uniref:Uncharacterized protein n=1 Tax=Littorina saxatilis TaxID=31220 RepID=A0AAN9G1R2_9CAEN
MSAGVFSAAQATNDHTMTTATHPPALGGLRVDPADRSTMLFKMVLLGETGVGKTCLAARLSDRPVPAPHTPTIGVDFSHFTRSVDDIWVRINLWDTAGQERFHCLLPAYCRRAHAAIFVFDLTDVRTFLSIDKSLRKAYETLPDDACKVC